MVIKICMPEIEKKQGGQKIKLDIFRKKNNCRFFFVNSIPFYQ